MTLTTASSSRRFRQPKADLILRTYLRSAVRKCIGIYTVVVGQQREVQRSDIQEGTELRLNSLWEVRRALGTDHSHMT